MSEPLFLISTRHDRLSYPDVYKCFQEMARARLTAPGSKEALMAMRSRSIRRCAIIKQKTRKDPLTGKPLFGDEEQTVFEEKAKDKTKDKDKSTRELSKNHTHNSSTRSSGSKQTSTEASSITTEVSPVATSSPALEARMDKLEAAMCNLTDLMMTMNQKLDQV